MELTFDGFKERANDKSLTKWEKIGFPDSYRKDNEKKIFEDVSKKTNLERKGIKILDIGCGCSDLVNHFIENAIKYDQELYLVDSIEMLNNIDEKMLKSNIHLTPGCFPKIDLAENEKIKFDIIIIYSVIQYVFLEQSVFNFIHKCLNILKKDGCILIGDIPNISARNRFLNSEEGKTFLSKNNDNKEALKFEHENFERLDDSIIISLLSRYRNFGCETYLLPQSKELTFSNRREDILILKR
jgi:2-polyprenyl-3-methyl-5-hydroxy-6-metoxy-1,4-benzoquinol methylase